MLSDIWLLLNRAFEGFGWRDTLDIVLVAAILYWLLRLIRETRAFQMMRGLALLLIGALVARKLALPTTTWLFNSLLLLWAVGLIVTLQPELRRLISVIGEHFFFRSLFPQGTAVYREIAEACTMLAMRGWGGLVVIERETSLAGFAESGTVLNSEVNAELLATIFTPGSPLHDGGVIVRGDRLYAAGCILPMSEAKLQSHPAYGMRHRAAMGITEETDALAVVVSEERKQVSLAMNGQLTPPLDSQTLVQMLGLHGKGKR